MGRWDNPWDSPFGRNKGKLTVPDKKPPERQRGGCGNPTCNICYNPDGSLTAEAQSGIMTSQVEGDMPSREDEMANMRREYERMMRMKNDVGFYPSVQPEFEEGPPKAYNDARKAVEKWIGPDQETSYAEIVGNEEALDQLDDAIRAPKEHAELYKAYGMKMPKGAMLFGPPGCGKTMFAKAAVNTMTEIYGKKAEYLIINGTDIQAPIVGLTEKYIRDIFAYGREYKKYHGFPLLVFIDEAEILLPDRTGRGRRVASWEQSQVAGFLAEMDGIKDNGVFLLLATNRPDQLDEAVLRDGRCDFKIEVKRPTKEAASVILANSFKDMHTKEPVEDLVFAALESLYSPHFVIGNAKAVEVNMEEKKITTNGKDFCLEHIISGAMLVSLRQRAIRRAFSRDKKTGNITGVQTGDVLEAVQGLFEENKDLVHQFALEEFMETFGKEVEDKRNAENKKGMN